MSDALACGLRIASESAILTTAFAKVGFSRDDGGTFVMSNLIGAAKAWELSLLSSRIDALGAERLGFIDRAVPDDALEKEALTLAQRLAHGPSVA